MHLNCFSASILFSEKYIRVEAHMLVFGNLKHRANIIAEIFSTL